MKFGGMGMLSELVYCRRQRIELLRQVLHHAIIQDEVARDELSWSTGSSSTGSPASASQTASEELKKLENRSISAKGNTMACDGVCNVRLNSEKEGRLISCPYILPVTKEMRAEGCNESR